MTILEQLERDLGEVAERRWGGAPNGAGGSTEPRARPRRFASGGSAEPGAGRRRLAPGTFVALAGVAVAIAVAAVAVLLLAHRRPATGRASLAPAAGLNRGDLVPRSQPTLAWLLSHFAVLRRPQTAADLTPALQVRLLGTGPRLSRLTRVVRSLRDGTRIVLAVSREGSDGQPEVLVLYVVQGGQLGGEPYDADVGYTVYPGSLTWNGRTEVWASLVPDGVARVRWVFPRQNGLRTHVYPRPLVVDVHVQGNVAAAEVARSATWNPAVVTWYDRGGRIVASFRRSDPNRVLPPSPASSALAILEGDGIARVHFGASAATLSPTLRGVLGAAAGPYPQGQCGFDHELPWPGFTAYLAHGRFVGYVYAPLRRGQRVRLETNGLLTVGEPLARARSRFGTALSTSFAQGGVWRLATPHGRLSGFLSGLPWDAGVHIATIGAGVLGCPALSP